MAIWNKYPYTDFHELNADYVFTWIKNAQDFIDEFTAKVNQNTADIVSLKTRMTTAEGDISGLKTRMTSAEGRLTTAEGKITTIENTLITDGAAIDALESAVSGLNNDVDRIDQCALMNSTQLERVANPQSTATKVTLQFESERYSSGAAAAGGMVDLDLPQATQQHAGTMNAADKQKVDQLAISGDIDLHDAALEVVADKGLLVDEVDSTNQLAVPNLAYLNANASKKTVTIVDGDLYQPTPTAGAPVQSSAFAQNTNGQLYFIQQNGPKAFYFYAGVGAALRTQLTDGSPVIRFTIPAAYRPSLQITWPDFMAQDNSGNDVGRFIPMMEGDDLAIFYKGSGVASGTMLAFEGIFLPFM